MPRSQVHLLLLVALLSSPLPTRTLRAEIPDDDKDLAELLFLEFLSELMAARGGAALAEPREDREEVGVGQQVMRRHLHLTQRERKAGCRNFFWKTFTSC